ncbi:UDP-N-acetylglucosamine 2-epimerase [Microbacterium sp. NIBRBAC000506063]|uniref:UDP-N-acetylglucosamine 2-epimerase n=1 Tax=Microbacterium sp. NIBRBAC000506063 TaxID=2734618 RepID=UPI00397FC71C
MAGDPRIVLTEPLGYPDLVRTLRLATLVLTDSGGIQEEACSLGVPTLVARDTTERPEGRMPGSAARRHGSAQDRRRGGAPAHRRRRA